MGRRCFRDRAIFASVAIAGVASVAIGCGGSSDSGDSGDSSDSSTAAATAPSCGPVKPAQAKSLSYGAPKQVVRPGEGLKAVVSTNCGAFSIALDSKRFPTAVNSFVFLARKGFYDGVPFDQAGAGTYLHGGDPPGPATGPGYEVTEPVSPGLIYRHGIVAMAETGKAPEGHAGSQFFVVVARPWLDSGVGSPPIGTVEAGFDVLERISMFGPGDPDEHTNLGTTGPVGKLSHPVAIEKILIEKG